MKFPPHAQGAWDGPVYIQREVPMATTCFMKSLVAAAAMTAVADGANADSNLGMMVHSDLKMFDPIWTTVYVSRDYG